MKKFLKGFIYAYNGICCSALERNMRVHLLVTLMVLAAGFYFQIKFSEWLWIILASGIVMTAEVFNTAFETVINLVRDDLKVPYANKKLGKAKDLAAGAVLISAIAAGMIGMLIFIPYFIPLLFRMK